MGFLFLVSLQNHQNTAPVNWWKVLLTRTQSILWDTRWRVKEIAQIVGNLLKFRLKWSWNFILILQGYETNVIEYGISMSSKSGFIKREQSTERREGQFCRYRNLTFHLKKKQVSEKVRDVSSAPKSCSRSCRANTWKQRNTTLKEHPWRSVEDCRWLGCRDWLTEVKARYVHQRCVSCFP